MKVFGVDGQFIQDATDRAAQLQKITLAHAHKEGRGPEAIGSVRFVQRFLELNVEEEDFLSTFDTDEDLFLVGLHTCGALASTMLRLFVNSPRIKFFVGAGCCYYKGDPDVYPMSCLAKELGVPISHWAYRLACQVESYGI